MSGKAQTNIKSDNIIQYMNLPSWTPKIALSFLIYAIIINTITAFQLRELGGYFTPEQWLFHPIKLLMELHQGAIIVLFLSFLLGLILFEKE
jgi:hypothetical protein